MIFRAISRKQAECILAAFKTGSFMPFVTVGSAVRNKIMVNAGDFNMSFRIQKVDDVWFGISADLNIGKVSAVVFLDDKMSSWIFQDKSDELEFIVNRINNG